MKQPSIHRIEDFDIAIHSLLFKTHTHAELCQPEEIVYKEADVVALIKKTIELYGAPEPEGIVLKHVPSGRPNTGDGANQVKGMP